MRFLRSCAFVLALSLLGLAAAATLQDNKQDHHENSALRHKRNAVSITPISVQISTGGGVSVGTAGGAEGIANIGSFGQPAIINIPGVQGVSNPAQLLVLSLSPATTVKSATNAQCPVLVSGASATTSASSGTNAPKVPSKTNVKNINEEISSDNPNNESSNLPPEPPKDQLPTKERRARNAPHFPPVEDSQLLLQQFHAQVARTLSLPPVVPEPLVTNVVDEVVDVPDPLETASVTPVPAPNTGPHQEQGKVAERCKRSCQQKPQQQPPADNPTATSSSSPPMPRFDRSMTIKAVLTAYQADYSEPYTVWWDAASGASRIDHHGGTASSYRIMRLDGRVQSVQMRLDRTEETDIRRCWTMEPRRLPLALRALPILPNLSGFVFTGYVKVPSSNARVERWRHTVRSAGEGPEVLTYRHELLVIRAADNYTTSPLRYAVAIDSSLLGNNCDSYAHRFLKVELRNHDPSMFRLNLRDACEQIVSTDNIDIVEPLREFTLLQRDGKYDRDYQGFKTLYARRYADELEEAIRKSVLIQNSRFVSSGNRKGASFEMEVNFFGDRLLVEKNLFTGLLELPNNYGEPFPHSAEELNGLRGRLPRSFDWRVQGAVTPVRNQGTCSSCWAFSVVGAVEGALFVNTGRLVPLSEQTLVDCGHQYGTNGCGNSWPSHAFDYVQHQGLPALDEYTPYAVQKLECKADRVPSVTRISGHVNVTSKDIVALKVAIQKHGPTIVLVNSREESFYSHTKGYYSDAKCRPSPLTHAVLAVGWTVYRGETYFILKNSWSSTWAEEGYIKIRANTNTCGVLQRPTYPILRRADVLHIPANAPTAARLPKT